MKDDNSIDEKPAPGPRRIGDRINLFAPLAETPLDASSCRHADQQQTRLKRPYARPATGESGSV